MDIAFEQKVFNQPPNQKRHSTVYVRVFAERLNDFSSMQISLSNELVGQKKNTQLRWELGFSLSGCGGAEKLCNFLIQAA